MASNDLCTDCTWAVRALKDLMCDPSIEGNMVRASAGRAVRLLARSRHQSREEPARVIFVHTHACAGGLAHRQHLQRHRQQQAAGAAAWARAWERVQSV